ncbi:MAG: hypothetical protein HKN03_18740, partial [Acidimicrobiales bacterium]|nr:hypothetical protein [Acidimicrobiales bacterium]
MTTPNRRTQATMVSLLLAVAAPALAQTHHERVQELEAKTEAMAQELDELR